MEYSFLENNDPLEYVFKRLVDTYNVEFILKDAELGKYSYKATFEGESLNEILRLLENECTYSL